MDPEALSRRLRDADEEAWRTFLERYGHIINAVAARLGFDGPDRDDLFQVACLSVMESIHTLRDPTRIASWLYSVTYRLGIDTLRSRRPETAVGDTGGERDASEEPGHEPAISRELELMEESAALMEALARLDD
ncbi:MAG: sigma-70 family RNA polymerase sigma factor, partial [Candidatus Eisenbacteria bacterium]|nr:sigma-70 family RNA polymerase sigma factor [Candidatus Eisenbacteria bacterium]